MNNEKNLLHIRDLKTHFHTAAGNVRAVDGVTLKIPEGSTVGVVGESGCGKTVLALSIMRLLPVPPAKIVAGEILLDNTDLLKLDAKAMRLIRGKKISMIFQEPMTSLNPIMTIGEQISEVIRLHEGQTRKGAQEQTVEIMRRVGIEAPEKRISHYPHQMSGGMRQRVMIAMALVCKPRLMIADEPTTALDVTVQAQILELMDELQQSFNTSILFISHDLGVIAHSVDYVIIMYAGKIVEESPVAPFFSDPLHPYSLGLLEAIPTLRIQQGKRLQVIPGSVPDVSGEIRGCAFCDRCGYVMAVCREKEPVLYEKKPNRYVRCWKEL